MEFDYCLSYEQLICLFRLTEVVSKSPDDWHKYIVKFDGSSEWGRLSFFVASVTMAKTIVRLDDEQILAKLPELLEGSALTWWGGEIHRAVHTWKEAAVVMHEKFRPTRHPYEIYQRVFQEKQHAPTSLVEFIATKMALLAELPKPGLPEPTQIDMIYSTMHQANRDIIPRESISTFADLIYRAGQLDKGVNTTVNTSDIESLRKRIEDIIGKPKHS